MPTIGILSCQGNSSSGAKLAAIATAGGSLRMDHSTRLNSTRAQRNHARLAPMSMRHRISVAPTGSASKTSLNSTNFRLISTGTQTA